MSARALFLTFLSLLTSYCRVFLTPGGCALAALAFCCALCVTSSLAIAGMRAETLTGTGAETLAGRGEVRGVMSPPVHAAVPSPSGDVEDQPEVVVNGNLPAGSAVAGDASAVPNAAARRNTLIQNAGNNQQLTGGQTDKGEAVGNKVILNDGTAVQVSGAYTQSGNLHNNTVEINGGTVGGLNTGFVYGAYGEHSILAEKNSVTVTAGTIRIDICGARIDTILGVGVVRDNHVVITGGTVEQRTFGGFVENGDAYGNSISLSGTGDAGTLVGGSALKEAHGNFVEISGGAIARDATGGVGNVLAKDNYVTMSGGIVKYNIEGGAGGEVINNKVTISGGTVGTVGGAGTKVAGGSGTAKAQGNIVKVTGGEILVGTFGGHSTTGDALENEVSIEGTAKVEQVVGGQSDAASAADNEVYIKGGEVRGPIIGGNGTIAASKNYVEMTGGTAHDMYAGRSVNGTVSGNSAQLSGGTVGAVWGGYTEGGDASGNTAVLDGAISTGNIVGGESTLGTAADNVVQVKSGEAVNVYGGQGFTAATDNTVTMTGGTVTGEVVGGFGALNGAASGNSVHISGGIVGGIANSYIAGGVAGGTGTAINNTVTLSGAGRTRSGGMADLSGAAVYGGYAPSGTSGDVFTGNTLHVLEFQGKARTVANFEQYNFFLPAHIANGSVVMQFSEATNISAPAGQSIRARITGMVDGGARLNGGDVIHLLQSDVSFVATGMDLTGGNFSQGLTRNYDYELRLTGTSLDAIILGAELPPEVDAPTDGPNADGGLVNGGADLVAGAGMDSALVSARIALRPHEQANPWGVGVFGAFTGGQTRYNIPSKLHLNSTHYAVGVTKLFDLGSGELLVGGFLDAGFGSYMSQRKAAGRAAGADGDSKYYGGGVLGRYMLKKGKLAGTYVEGTARTGLVESTYESRDLQDVARREVKYARRVPYYSAHGGVGYVYPITDHASVDIYGKFFWSRLDGSTQRIAGDEFTFTPLDSYRLRGGARFNYALGESISVYAGAAYEHEFDGRPRAAVDGEDIKGDDMRGGTGIGELGLSFTLGEEGNFSMDLGAQGFVGKREGVMGSVRAQYAF